MGRWTQLCGECIEGGRATPLQEQCGGCGVARATRATVDGSGSCKDCAWGADAATIWMARCRRLCEHGAKQEGIRLSTDQGRDLVVALAQRWARRESFVGNAIRWAEIIAQLAETPSIPVSRNEGQLHGEWTNHMPQQPRSKQITLQAVGVTGGRQTVGTGGKARTGNRPRCQELPTSRGPRAREEESAAEEDSHAGCNTPRPAEEGAQRPTPMAEGNRGRAGEAAEGDGPAETEERGGGDQGKVPGAAAREARGARLAGGRRLPAARRGGGKTKTKKQMGQTHRREGSGSASTPVPQGHGRSGLVGGRGQGGVGRAWDNDGQGKGDRPSGEPPD